MPTLPQWVEVLCTCVLLYCVGLGLGLSAKRMATLEEERRASRRIGCERGGWVVCHAGARHATARARHGRLRAVVGVGGGLWLTRGEEGDG